MRRIALLSTSDTDLLSARASGAAYRLGNPARHDIEPLLDGVDVVVLRILGSSAEIADELKLLRATGLPLVVLGGERSPSAELMECSTVPIGLAAQAHAYLAEGGPANLAQLHAFLCDTVLLTGEGFDEPAVIPEWGFGQREGVCDDAVRIGVLYYRAHEVSGNAGFAHALADAIDGTGRAVGVPIFAASLRNAPDELFAALGQLDALVVCMLAAGGAMNATASVSAGDDDGAWDIERIAALDIPVFQGLCLASPRADWAT